MNETKDAEARTYELYTRTCDELAKAKRKIAELERRIPDEDAAAFPHGFTGHRGMSLRDWFAGQALAGIFATPQPIELSEAAECAYDMADEMLECRKRE